jgi:dihydropyrimidine dehydrogenase (NAD+) subunit PreT
MSTAALPHDEQLRARFGELKPALTAQAAVIEADRCLNCFDAPCTAACPTHIDVPGFIKRIASGNLRGSALRILDANILGASCARVCPVDVLCEGACVLTRQNRKPIQIGQLQRHAMDAFWASGETVPVAAAGTHKLRVACIGGGPASLACAAELCRQGARATVIERRELPGGLNTYGVAEYKLRAADSVREVEMIRRLGVEFRCGVEVDSAAALEALEAEFDFVFLGLGLGAMQRLNIPGEEAEGVMNALELIAAYKTGHLRELHGTVVVVGAGTRRLMRRMRPSGWERRRCICCIGAAKTILARSTLSMSMPSRRVCSFYGADVRWRCAMRRMAGCSLKRCRCDRPGDRLSRCLIRSSLLHAIYWYRRSGNRH